MISVRSHILYDYMYMTDAFASSSRKTTACFALAFALAFALVITLCVVAAGPLSEMVFFPRELHCLHALPCDPTSLSRESYTLSSLNVEGNVVHTYTCTFFSFTVERSANTVFMLRRHDPRASVF